MECDNESDEVGVVGSSFDGFLHDQGTYEEATAQAINRVRAFHAAHVLGEPDLRLSKPKKL